jgi:hypothetical protein
LAVFNFLIACLISDFDGRLRFIFSSSSALLISGITSGGDLATQAEEAANMRNMNDLYDTTKNLAGNFRQTSQQIKMFAVRSGFAFRASGGMLSGPEALAVFNFLIACLISVFDGRC